MALIGHWKGGFHPSVVEGKTDEPTLERDRLSGVLQIYAGKKFLMEQQGANQKFSVKGTWTVEEKRLTLQIGEFEFDNPSVEDQKAMNLKVYAPDDLRAGFGRSLTFDLAADGQTLTGLAIDVGPRSGKFTFRRDMRVSNEPKN